MTFLFISVLVLHPLSVIFLRKIALLHLESRLKWTSTDSFIVPGKIGFVAGKRGKKKAIGKPEFSIDT